MHYFTENNSVPACRRGKQSLLHSLMRASEVCCKPGIRGASAQHRVRGPKTRFQNPWSQSPDMYSRVAIWVHVRVSCVVHNGQTGPSGGVIRHFQLRSLHWVAHMVRLLWPRHFGWYYRRQTREPLLYGHTIGVSKSKIRANVANLKTVLLASAPEFEQTSLNQQQCHASATARQGRGSDR